MALHLAKYDVRQFLAKKRALKKKRKQIRIARKRLIAAIRQRTFDAKFGKSSRIISMMAKYSPSPTVPFQRTISAQLPKRFSVVDEPEIVFNKLSDLACQLKAYRLGSVFLDFSKVEEQDLSANGLLDVLVDELSTAARRTGHKIRWRGTYPANANDKRFVKAMGVIKRLQIEHEYPRQEEVAELELFDARCKHYMRVPDARQQNKNSRTTQKFADHIDRCLKRVNRTLLKEARGRLCQYVSEIIDNAEEHAQMGDWSIQGYLDTHLDTPMCEISIYNFGHTIAETLEALPDDSYTRDQVKRYIDLHEKGGFFKADWRREDLYTLIALQGNVSSKNHARTDTRGNGTVDLIGFFQRVLEECSEGKHQQSARMAIASGSTFIMFDGSYQMKPDENGVNIIAFNKNNSLEERPDARYVRRLTTAHFPGTVISLKFPLSTASSTSAVNGGKR